MVKIWKVGSDVDTDQIVPGRYAPYMRPNDELGDAVFIEARPDFNQNAQSGDLLVAEDNFGCGSSREYAPLALKRREIGAIIANNFARIFFRNAVNLGIPLFVAPEIVSAVNDGDEVDFDLESESLRVNGVEYSLPALPGFAREVIEVGGMVTYVREHQCFPGEEKVS